jgi:hypothetical protein
MSLLALFLWLLMYLVAKSEMTQMRIRNVLIFILLSLVVLLSAPVYCLSQEYKQARSELQSFTESRDNAISIAEMEEGKARHTLESKLSNAEYELGRCQRRQKTAGASEIRKGCEPAGQVTVTTHSASSRTALEESGIEFERFPDYRQVGSARAWGTDGRRPPGHL